MHVSAPSPKCPGLGSTRMKLPNFKVRDREARERVRSPELCERNGGCDLIGKRVLDVAGGVSSFCAEANNLVIKMNAFDPIYSLSAEKIRERSDPDLEFVYRSIGLVPTYRWKSCV